MRARVITMCSAARLPHLRVQRAALRHQGEADPVIVWLDAEEPPVEVAESATTVHVPPGENGMRLAAGRNDGARIAIHEGADLLVFLDVDCVPGPELMARYRAAADSGEVGAGSAGVLCGPVTYLPAEADANDPDDLARRRSPHAARPDPAPDTVVTATAEQYPLFWSLSFAVTASEWDRGPSFDPRYEGYGAEDTDFAFALRREGTPIRWVGGADAFHQWHETSDPPWAHLDDILRNGALFAERWGEWPMTGWLERFEAAGAVRRLGDGWARV